MENYEELKCYSKSIRMTESVFRYIENFPDGKNFNDKFDKMMIATMTQEQDALLKEKAELLKEIEQLNKEKEFLKENENLQKEIEQFNEAKKNLSIKTKAFVKGIITDLGTLDIVSGGEMISEILKEKEKNVRKQLAENGYKPAPDIIRNIVHLNEITGRKHSMEELSMAYKDKAYEGNTEAQETLKRIGQVLQEQEMQMKIE